MARDIDEIYVVALSDKSAPPNLYVSCGTLDSPTSGSVRYG